MTRDRKSFLADLIFPSLLMAIALYLNDIQILSDEAPTRKLHPDGFPLGQTLIHNENNFNQTDGEVGEFIDKAFGADIGTLWSKKEVVKTSVKEDFWTQVREVDNTIFKARE